MITKGPTLTKEQARVYLQKAGWAPTRAYRVFHAYQLTVGENGLTKGQRQFTITGPPTKRSRDLMRWRRTSRVVAIVPCGSKGWRAILTPIPIDPACWI